MMEIHLSAGRIALVDDSDFETISKMKWSFCGRYARRSYRVNGVARSIYMHRFILRAPNDMVVDHVNGNKLDNRRSNLRLATKSQNGMNRAANRSNTSGFKGVYFSRIAQKWSAEIWTGGKKTYLGLFKSAEAASRAYVLASSRMHGEFSFTESSRLSETLEASA